MAYEPYWSKPTCSLRPSLVPVELVNAISQQGFQFDSPNFQDSYNLALSQTVLHIGHIGQHLHAC